jgi:hypothetical protein
MQFSPCSFYLIPVRIRYSPKHHGLRYLQSVVFLLQRETKFHTRKRRRVINGFVCLNLTVLGSRLP